MAVGAHVVFDYRKGYIEVRKRQLISAGLIPIEKDWG
jgi:hypothetical protein